MKRPRYLNWPEFRVGDRVAYRARFLRNTGQWDYDSAALRGEVIEMRPIGKMIIPVVRWSPTWAHPVHPGNLAFVRADGLVLEPV